MKRTGDRDTGLLLQSICRGADKYSVFPISPTAVPTVKCRSGNECGRKQGNLIVRKLTQQIKRLTVEFSTGIIRRGADKSLAFPSFYFPICSAIKRIFLGWVKKVRTTNHKYVELRGEYVE
jgi:hypothetical protein